MPTINPIKDFSPALVGASVGTVANTVWNKIYEYFAISEKKSQYHQNKRATSKAIKEETSHLNNEPSQLTNDEKKQIKEHGLHYFLQENLAFAFSVLEKNKGNNIFLQKDATGKFATPSKIIKELEDKRTSLINIFDRNNVTLNNLRGWFYKSAGIMQNIKNICNTNPFNRKFLAKWVRNIPEKYIWLGTQILLPDSEVQDPKIQGINIVPNPRVVNVNDRYKCLELSDINSGNKQNLKEEYFQVAFLSHNLLPLAILKKNHEKYDICKENIDNITNNSSMLPDISKQNVTAVLLVKKIIRKEHSNLIEYIYHCKGGWIIKIYYSKLHVVVENNFDNYLEAYYPDVLDGNSFND